MITRELDGQMPQTAEELERLPGIGSYTAAAVASFAHGERTTVLDTNVRRVLIRLFAGRDRPSASPGRAETQWASRFVPEVDHVKWNSGVMEFGALVCTAKNPQCQTCPLNDICAWQKAGRPASAIKPKTQKWAGTDRQLRGAVMDVLKSAHTEAGSEFNDSVAVDLFTAPTTTIDPDLFDTIGLKTSATLQTMRDLTADTDRIKRIIDALVVDGLAAQQEDRLRLPL